MAVTRILALSESKADAIGDRNVNDRNPFSIFEEYYKDYLAISQFMLRLPVLHHFPPGLVPLIHSYCRPDLPPGMTLEDQLRLDNYIVLRRQVSKPVFKVESKHGMIDDLSITLPLNNRRLTGEDISKSCKVTLHKNGRMSWRWVDGFEINYYKNHEYYQHGCDCLLDTIKNMLGIEPVEVSSLFDENYINERLQKANKMMPFIIAAAHLGHEGSMSFLSYYYATLNNLGLFSDTRQRYPEFNYLTINACKQTDMMVNNIVTRFRKPSLPQLFYDNQIVDTAGVILRRSASYFCENMPGLRFGFFKLCRQVPIPQSRTINDLLEMSDESVRLFALRVRTSPMLDNLMQKHVIPYLPPDEKDHPNVEALLKAMDCCVHLPEPNRWRL